MAYLLQVYRKISFMPALLLFLFLAELFTVAFIVLDIHLIREWYLWKDTFDNEYARHCLYGAIALTAYSLLGKFPVSWLVSKFRKNEDEPKQNTVYIVSNLKGLTVL